MDSITAINKEPEAFSSLPALSAMIHPVAMVSPEQQHSPALSFLSLPAEVRLMVYRFLFQVQVKCYLSVLHPNFSLQRTPAILQTNRLIYAEAVAVLYREITIVPMSDNLCEMPHLASISVARLPKIWKHDPFTDPGERTFDCKYRYETAELGGDLYPHVFGRFQKMEFRANFRIFRIKTNGQAMVFPRPLTTIIDGTCSNLTNQKDYASRLFGRLSLFERLVNLLSLNSTISTLKILFDTLCPLPKIHEGSLFPKIEKTALRFLNFLSDFRTVEMFVTSGLLEPLRRVDNVERLSLEYDIQLAYSKPNNELLSDLPFFRSRYMRLDALELMKSIEVEAREGWMRSQNHNLKYEERVLRESGQKDTEAGSEA